MPTKWRCWFWDRARVIAREARQTALLHSLWWLEVKDCNENRHEGGHGRCRQNGVVGFGIVRAQRMYLRSKRASLWWLEVKDCNENRYEGGHGHC